jgi:hypothetical protein
MSGSGISVITRTMARGKNDHLIEIPQHGDEIRDGVDGLSV